MIWRVWDIFTHLHTYKDAYEAQLNCNCVNQFTADENRNIALVADSWIVEDVFTKERRFGQTVHSAVKLHSWIAIEIKIQHTVLRCAFCIKCEDLKSLFNEHSSVTTRNYIKEDVENTIWVNVRLLQRFLVKWTSVVSANLLKTLQLT